MTTRNAVVIGAGFGGLAVAALLARQGMKVTVVEKNEMAGGKARVWKKDGFTFDMGPSWYLMPEVFENFFSLFGKKREDYYELIKLDPFYRVFFDQQEMVDITSDPVHNTEIFDHFEAGGGDRLKSYLDTAKFKYDTAMREFMYVDYRSVLQFMNRRMMTEGLKLDMFSPLDKYVRKYFQDRRARQILEYAMVFLGNSPHNAPALYSIMSHVDFNLGVWYPCGGMGEIAKGFEKLASEMGVEFKYNLPVTEIMLQGNRVKGVVTPEGEIEAEAVIVNADYAFAETALLPKQHQAYPESYWNKKVIAPSMLLAYLGVDKKIDRLAHHTLYFTENWDLHFNKIFDQPAWPEEFCYYVGCTSRTDKTTAPQGKENIFFLIPVAAGLEDTPEIREEMFNRGMDHFEGLVGESIRDSLLVKRLFSIKDFEKDYNAYRGTALGLAHTLKQTAVYRPGHRSKNIKNLYYTGQYNHPGVGVPMVLISSQVVAEIIGKELI